MNLHICQWFYYTKTILSLCAHAGEAKWLLINIIAAALPKNIIVKVKNKYINSTKETTLN